MGKGPQQKGANGKGSGASPYIKKVDRYKLAVKWFLRSYVDRDGQMMFTDGQKATKYFTSDNMREVLDGEHSELIRRLGMGVNLFANTVESGLGALNCFFLPKDISDEDLENVDKSFKETGLPEFLQWLREDGSDLLGVVQYLNKTNEEVGTEKQTAKRFRKLLNLLADDHDDKMKALARMADVSARLYGLSVHLMEFIALASNLEEWGKKVPEVEKQSPAVRKWVKNPKDQRLLAKAVAANYAEGGEKKKRKKALDSSDDEEDIFAAGDDSDADSGDDDSDGEKQKGKRGKDKKERKKE